MRVIRTLQFAGYLAVFRRRQTCRSFDAEIATAPTQYNAIGPIHSCYGRDAVRTIMKKQSALNQIHVSKEWLKLSAPQASNHLHGVNKATVELIQTCRWRLPSGPGLHQRAQVSVRVDIGQRTRIRQ